jgi:serine/threonine protein kinase
MFGRYDLQRLLGRGGMGVVWLANDSRLERLVALKFLPEMFFLDAAARDELKRETRRSLELTHPNVVRIYDFVEDDEAAAISMEYIDGHTLSHLRVERPNRCFETDEMHGWIADICRALDYAHREAHAVHRDLKPANLMVTQRGVLKVADFGIACSMQNTAARVSAWSSSGGTLGYMSPQQLQGELSAPSDDIYSVGATLYELLTSKPPFYSGDISLQIRSVTPESISDRRRALGVEGAPVPLVWEQTIAACLAKSPRERPATAGEIVRLLGIDPSAISTLPTSDDMATVADLSDLREPVSGGRGPGYPTSAKRPPTAPKRVSPEIKEHTFSMRPWAALAGLFLLSVLVLMLWPTPKPEKAVDESAAVSQAVPAVVGAATPGGVMIKTDPPGASVTVSSFAQGVSPASLWSVPDGLHPVEIELAGFERVSMNAQVRAGEFTDLGTLKLERSTGTLQLTTDPEDSSYTLLAQNGETVIRSGRTPEAIPGLPTGEYFVRLQRDGWPAELRKVTVERQQTLVAAHRFGTGTLRVTSDPPGAEIVLGDRPLGATPLNVALPTGQYGPFVAILDGYELVTFEANLQPDATTMVPPLMLKPQAPRLVVETTPPGIVFEVFAGAVESPASASIRTGTSPATLEDLAPGPYRVVFSQPPWPSRSAAIEVAERGTTLLEPEFAHGILKATSEPDGAEIFSDGKLLGTAPLEIPLPPEKYVITARQGGRTAKPRTVTLAADETEDVRFDFRTGTSTSTKSKNRRPRKKKVEDTVVTKIGRSLKTFFSGQKSRK